MVGRRRALVSAGAAALAFVLAGCSGSTSNTTPETEPSDEPSSASTVPATDEGPADTEEQDEAAADDGAAAPAGVSSDLTEVLLAADLPLDVLGLERGPDLDPRVELVDDHFLVCPQDSATVVNVAQTDFLLAGTVVREFLIFDDDAGARAFLDAVEAANLGGCESVLEREDGPSRTAVVESFEPITVDGAEGYRWVAVQQVDMPDRAPSNVTRVQVQDGNVVVVATMFVGFVEDAPDLDALVQDGLELVRSTR